MKTYTMLQTVRGSRDGIHVETFNEGETYELDAALAEQFYHQGAVEEVGGDGGGANPREGARTRASKVAGPAETKVTGPTDTKAGEAGVDPDTQRIEELVAVARDHYGLDVDSTMDEGELRLMIEQAKGDADAETTDDADGRTDAKGKKRKK